MATALDQSPALARIESILAEHAEPLLTHTCTTIRKEHLHLPGGHVGAMVSRGAAKSLWPKLSGWWKARDGEASTTRRTGGARARARD